MTAKNAESFLEIGAAYIRVSTDDQTELSPDAQVRVIQEEAKKDGFFIPTEYIFIEHKGISGRKASNRPEFQKMIATAKSQKPSPFKRLYLWKFSRFARNQEESTFYKGILRKKCGKEAYENEVDTLEEYKDNKCRLQAERKSLLTSLERLHQEQPDFSNQIAHKQKLLAEIATIYDFVLDPNVSNEDKGNALRRVLKKIVFDRKTSVFTFFYYVS